MTRTTSNVARSNEHEEHPSPGGQEIQDQLSQEQFNEELDNDVAFMLTQEESGEEQGGEAGREGETNESGEDDDSTSGYERPEDPHPSEPRRKLTEDKLDKDFNPNEKVEI
jgi:hypothetical protein